MVKRRIDHLRADMNAKLADRNDADCVSKDTQGNDCYSENGALPTSSEKELASNETSDEQNECRMNAAALGRDMKANAGKLKGQAVPEE